MKISYDDLNKFVQSVAMPWEQVNIVSEKNGVLCVEFLNKKTGQIDTVYNTNEILFHLGKTSN